MSKAKILLVDDDADFRASLRPLLKSHDFEVIEAASGKEALEQLTASKPDIILLDIIMESPAEGYSITQALKFQKEYREYRDTPIVVVSSIQSTPDELFRMGGEPDMIRPNYYFTKPLDVPRFLARLEELARERAGQSASSEDR